MDPPEEVLMAQDQNQLSHLINMPHTLCLQDRHLENPKAGAPPQLVYKLL